MTAPISLDRLLAKARLVSPAYTDDELAAADARLTAAAADQLFADALTFDDAIGPTLRCGPARPSRWESDTTTTEASKRYDAATNLIYLCRLVISQTNAFHAMTELPGGRIPDSDGARVLACVLHLAGREDSARFWWQFAAGAEDTTAMYCLFLHHLALGEIQEANWWHDQVPKNDGQSLWSRAVRADHRPASLGWATCLQVVLSHKGVPDSTQAVVDYVSSAVQVSLVSDIDLPIPADDFAARIEEMTTGV